jgi:hypothetical protein
MNPASAQEDFLRAAITTGLRIQKRFVASPVPGQPVMQSEGVATVQRIRASLGRRAARKGKRND